MSYWPSFLVRIVVAFFVIAACCTVAVVVAFVDLAAFFFGLPAAFFCVDGVLPAAPTSRYPFLTDTKRQCAAHVHV